MDCNPYCEDPEPRVPVVNLQLVDDYWLHNLDPAQLADITTKLRTQADYLDHEVRPALIAAREDWTTHHTTWTQPKAATATQALWPGLHRPTTE